MSGAAHIVQGIDHLIVMVRDLDGAERTWRALGFYATPRGFHRSGGTANHLVMLDRTYIELLGLASSSADSPYRATMENDPGLSGIALRGTAADTYRYWLAQGLEPLSPERLARDLEIDGRPEVARFELTRLQRSAELPFLTFCCEHLTPQFVWREGAPAHPNGARSLRELVIVVDGPQTAARFARVTDRRLSNSGDESSLELGGCRITFLSSDAFLRRFGSEAGYRLGRLPALAAFVVASPDPGRARQFAEEAGWLVRGTSSGGFVVHVPPEGVVIEWSPAT